LNNEGGYLFKKNSIYFILSRNTLMVVNTLIG
jgi:hypothetical protein